MHKGYGTLQKSNSTLLFCSRDINYKKPFGAVATDSNIEINFPIKESFNSKGVTLILRQGENTKKYSFTKTAVIDGYDIYTLNFSVDVSGTYFYRFEISKKDYLCFVGRGENGKAKIQDWLPEWQLSVYDKEYSVPDKYNGGVFYHIFVDRFCKAGETRYPKYGVLKEWNEDVTIMDSDGVYRANDFYGGNFQGIISKLDYLSSLGVNMLYLSPVFESHSNHRYDTGDYSKVDYLLGDEKDFEELIQKAAEKGIGIMLDGVFNHTGADSVYFNKFNHYPSLGAYQSKESPYYNWYTFKKFPEEYDCWWGITCVPTVSRNAEGYQQMIAGKGGVLEKRTLQGVKGWRLDVVDELSSAFVENIRSAIKDADSDSLVIGEVWEDASTKYSYDEERRYFRGKELDGVMNYPFRKAIMDYVNYHDSDTFVDRVMSICENYPIKSLNTCMTLLGSHDTVRIINSLAKISVKNTTKSDRRNYVMPEDLYLKARAKLLIASCLQYFLPGIPTIYYGDEIGMQGFEDPINRRTFDLEKADNLILEHYKKLGKLRTDNKKAFSGMFNYIKTEKDVIFIKRDKYLLIANSTKSIYQLANNCVDLLTGKEINKVEKMTAVIVIDE